MTHAACWQEHGPMFPEEFVLKSLPLTHIICFRIQSRKQVIRWGKCQTYLPVHVSFFFFLSFSNMYILATRRRIQTLHSLVLSEERHSKKYIKIDLGFGPKPFRTMVIRFYMEASLNVALILSLITFPVVLRGFMWRKYKAGERGGGQKNKTLSQLYYR